MLQRLAEKVGAQMRREDYFGRCVYVTIRYSDFRTLSRQRVLPYSTASTKEIFEMGTKLLKELWDGRAPLRLVGIGISQFGPPAGGIIQPSLFDSVSDKRLELEKRIDTLRERFGKEAVIPASLMKIKNGQVESKLGLLFSSLYFTEPPEGRVKSEVERLTSPTAT